MNWLPVGIAAFALLLVALAVYAGHRRISRTLSEVGAALAGVRARSLDPAAVKEHLDAIAQSASHLQTRAGVSAAQTQAASEQLRADVAALHASVASLDFAGIKSDYAALRLAFSREIARLHSSIADVEDSLQGVALTEVQDKMAALEKQLAAGEPEFCIGIVAQAVREQLEYERGHEERQKARMVEAQKNKSLHPERYDYDPDQRREAVMQRVRRLYAQAGRVVPLNAPALVDQALKEAASA